MPVTICMANSSGVDKTKKQTKSAEVFGRGFLVSMALFLAVSVLRRWFPAVYAAGFVTLCLGMLVYWVPPRPEMPFRNWALKVLQWTALVLLAGLLYSFFGPYVRDLIGA